MYNNVDIWSARSSQGRNFNLPKKEKTIKILDFNLDNIVVSKLIETKTNSKYLIGYLDEIIRPLVLILSKMSGYEWICLSI